MAKYESEMAEGVMAGVMASMKKAAMKISKSKLWRKWKYQRQPSGGEGENRRNNENGGINVMKNQCGVMASMKISASSKIISENNQWRKMSVMAAAASIWQ